MVPSEAIDRFLSRYAKIRTQKAYAIHLQLYSRWLKEEGVSLTPDSRSFYSNPQAGGEMSVV